VTDSAGAPSGPEGVVGLEGGGDSAPTNTSAAVHRQLERLAERYSAGENKIEAMRAREEYFELAGKVFDDDAELFEGRMAAFLEWYVLERPFRGGAAPVVQVLDDPALPVEERRMIALLAASHRSLFELHQVDDRTMDLEDVLGGARFLVTERRHTIGFNRGDLFEARVVSDGASVIFGKTFIFHPADARDVALAAVDSALERGVARDEILFDLARRHVRWHRFGHIGAAKIYRGE
jgi:hypothetical protein